jgi:hypothetical protein
VPPDARSRPAGREGPGGGRAPERRGRLGDRVGCGARGSPEKRFWIACAKRTPASVAYLLNLTRPAELPREYREPIRAFLVEALPQALALPPGKPNETTQREYDVNAALRVLDRWQDPDDSTVIASYLKYPSPFVQQHAKALLEDRQRPAPPAESR